MEDNDLTEEEYIKVFNEYHSIFNTSNIDIYQKFTCSNCGSRQTIDTPNIWYKYGTCEECGTLNSIQMAGMFIIITPLREN